MDHFTPVMAMRYFIPPATDAAPTTLRLFQVDGSDEAADGYASCSPILTGYYEI